MKNLKITINGTSYDVQVEEVGASEVSSAPVAPAPAAAPVPAAAPASAPKAAEPAPAPAAAPAAGAEVISAPMPGTIVSVNVNAGDNVKKGDVLVILEAMKMENDIVAPEDGTIASINVANGDAVESGAVLATLN